MVKNTLVIEINPCFTQESVFAAAATIGELPSPASFVYTPLATPVLIAVMKETTAVPAAPPSADSLENAQENISANAPGIAEWFTIRITIDPPMKEIAINGTTNCATFEIA